MERDHTSESEAVKKLNKVDKERAAYNSQCFKTGWVNADGCDLCINTDRFGIDEASDLISTTVANK